MTATGEERRYSFQSGPRVGLFGSFGISAIIPAGVGIVIAFVLMAAGQRLLAIIPVAVSLAVVFGRVHGRPFHEIAPTLLRWSWRRYWGRHRWYRHIPLVVDNNDIPTDLPPALQGLELLETDIGWWEPGRSTPLGMIHDRHAKVLTAAITVTGDGQFALADPDTQAARLDMWGLSLGAFCRERTPVCRIAWHE